MVVLGIVVLGMVVLGTVGVPSHPISHRLRIHIFNSEFCFELVQFSVAKFDFALCNIARSQILAVVNPSFMFRYYTVLSYNYREMHIRTHLC
jgi:hypothetical protein